MYEVALIVYKEDIIKRRKRVAEKGKKEKVENGWYNREWWV